MKAEAVVIKHLPIENGLNVHLLQTRKFKTNVIAVLLRGELTRENATRNALLAGLLRSGCEKYPSAREIAMRCEELYGAVFEVNVVKKGEEHIIQLFFESVKERGVFESAGELLHNVIYKPLVTGGGFSAEYTEAEKERLRQTIAGKINDKRRYALERMIEIMCEKERFGVSGDGCEKELYGLNSQNMLTHYNGVINKYPIEIGIIGDLDVECVTDWASKCFSRRRAEIAAPQPLEFVTAKRLREESEKAGVSQGKLVVGARCTPSGTGRSFYKLLLLSEVLGGSSSSRFFRNIREKHSLCYYIGSFIYRAKSIMVIQAGIDKQDYKRALDLIIDELKSAGEGGIAPWEVEQAKASLINQIEAQKDSPQALMDFYMTNVLLGDDTEISEVREIIGGIAEGEVAEAARGVTPNMAYFLAGD